MKTIRLNNLCVPDFSSRLFLQLPLHFYLSLAITSTWQLQIIRVIRGRLHYWLWKLCNEISAIRYMLYSVKYCAHARFASRLNFFRRRRQQTMDNFLLGIFFFEGEVLLNETLHSTQRLSDSSWVLVIQIAWWMWNVSEIIWINKSLMCSFSRDDNKRTRLKCSNIHST